MANARIKITIINKNLSRQVVSILRKNLGRYKKVGKLSGKNIWASAKRYKQLIAKRAGKLRYRNRTGTRVVTNREFSEYYFLLRRRPFRADIESYVKTKLIPKFLQVADKDTHLNVVRVAVVLSPESQKSPRVKELATDTIKGESYRFTTSTFEFFGSPFVKRSVPEDVQAMWAKLISHLTDFFLRRGAYVSRDESEEDYVYSTLQIVFQQSHIS